MPQPTTVAATFIAAHVANAEAHTGVMEGSGAQQCRQHHIKSSRPPGRGAAPTHKVCPLPGLPRASRCASGTGASLPASFQYLRSFARMRVTRVL